MAGKHVYVEKPFTNSVREAEELRDLADQKGLKVHVDHIMVYHPVIKKIKEIIDADELGDLLYFDCSRINLGPVSYTHLDVYKRQVWGRANTFLI